MKNTGKTNIRKLVLIALLGAVATVLMYFETPLPFMPPFLKLDASGVPVLVASFVLGPIEAVMVALIKALVHLLNTQTGGVGELADFIITGTFALSAGFIYRYFKTKNVNARVAAATVAGIAAIVFAGILANKFILIPFYSTMMPIDTIFELCGKVNPLVKDLNSYLLYGVAPFNAIKGAVIAALTLLVYKRIDKAVNR